MGPGCTVNTSQQGGFSVELIRARTTSHVTGFPCLLCAMQLTGSREAEDLDVHMSSTEP